MPNEIKNARASDPKGHGAVDLGKSQIGHEIK